MSGLFSTGLVCNCPAFLVASQPAFPVRAQHSPQVLLVVLAGLQGEAGSENQRGHPPGSSLRPPGAEGGQGQGTAQGGSCGLSFLFCKMEMIILPFRINGKD